MGAKIAVQAALVCAGAGLCLAAWSTLDEPAAHAADRPAIPLPATELAGDLVDTSGHTVEQLPQTVTRLPQVPAPKPAEDAQDPVRAAVIDAVQPVTAPELPDAPPRAARPAPGTPEAVPAVVLLAGPAPSTVTLDPAQAHDIGPAAAAALCDDPRPPRPDNTTAPKVAPCFPAGSDGTDGLAPVKTPTQTVGDPLAATTPSGPATPALRLLGELLPRSDLPTGRTEHPEPGPA